MANKHNPNYNYPVTADEIKTDIRFRIVCTCGNENCFFYVSTNKEDLKHVKPPKPADVYHAPGSKIAAVKHVRDAANLSLIEAKKLVDEAWNGYDNTRYKCFDDVNGFDVTVYITGLPQNDDLHGYVVTIRYYE